MIKNYKIQFLFLITLLNLSQTDLCTQMSYNLFLGAPPIIQKPNLDYLENLTHTAPTSRVTDLIDAKFYDGYIKAGDLSSTVASGNAMYTLTRPGRYYISGDIAVSPTNNNVTAIRITASDVLLDLNRATISQTSSSTATGLIGIELGTSSTSVANIIIQNGSVDSFSGTGISINSGCANLILRDLIVSRTASTGIYATNSNTIYLNNIKAISGFNTSSECLGLWLISCNNIAVQNSNFDNNNGTVSEGIVIRTSNQCVFENCTASNNGASENLAGTGVFIVGSTNCWFQSCQASYNKGFINGIGFNVISSSANLRFTNCSTYSQTASTHASDDLAAGFYFDETTKYSIIEDCYSYDNGNTTTKKGYGIYFGSATQALGPLKCIVRNCQIYNNIGATTSYGFYDAAAASSTILAHNVVSGNGAINPGSGNISPTDLNNANYSIYYSQSPDVHSTNNLFMEANLTAIGAINNTGILGDFQNLSIIQ